MGYVKPPVNITILRYGWNFAVRYLPHCQTFSIFSLSLWGGKFLEKNDIKFPKTVKNTHQNFFGAKPRGMNLNWKPSVLFKSNKQIRNAEPKRNLPTQIEIYQPKLKTIYGVGLPNFATWFPTGHPQNSHLLANANWLQTQTTNFGGKWCGSITLPDKKKLGPSNHPQKNTDWRSP